MEDHEGTLARGRVDRGTGVLVLVLGVSSQTVDAYRRTDMVLCPNLDLVTKLAWRGLVHSSTSFTTVVAARTENSRIGQTNLFECLY